MTCDQLTRHIHRRGILAGFATLAASIQRTAAQECAETGEECALFVRCCSGDCVTLPFNPNAGVCGTAVDDDDGGGPVLETCAELAARFDTTNDRRITCADFLCQQEAQDFLRRYPHDPCDLDAENDGTACEQLPACGPQQASRRRRRRFRPHRWPRRRVIMP